MSQRGRAVCLLFSVHTLHYPLSGRCPNAPVHRPLPSRGSRHAPLRLASDGVSIPEGGVFSSSLVQEGGKARGRGEGVRDPPSFPPLSFPYKPGRSTYGTSCRRSRNNSSRPWIKGAERFLPWGFLSLKVVIRHLSHHILIKKQIS